MKSLLVFGALLAFVYSYEFEWKIRRIWDDMDVFPLDGRVYIEEVQLFFSNMSNLDGQVLYYNFDWEWGNRYNDTQPVTNYIFRKWNVYPSQPDDFLTVEDLNLMYGVIDTDHQDSTGYIDFFWEFHPYFNNLYNETKYLPRNFFGKRIV